MVYDNGAADPYLYGGVDRTSANITTSRAAYAEASKRTGRSLAPAGMSLAQDQAKTAVAACRIVSRLVRRFQQGRRSRFP
jgi:hypothetical protein